MNVAPGVRALTRPGGAPGFRAASSIVRGSARVGAYLFAMQDLLGGLGRIAGYGLAPWVAGGSALRRSRVFHPRGVVLAGVVSPSAELAREYDALRRLEGSVLARFSGGFWKTREWLDVLGCALRFGEASPPAEDPQPGDQDVLLATIRHPLTTIAAALSTDQHDYLANDYFGVSPFVVAQIGRTHLRLRAERQPARGGSERSRDQRLRARVHAAPLHLELQARGGRLGRHYRTIAHIELRSEVAVDQRALHFDPFSCGRGLTPVGFVHGLRVATYRASRWARPT